MTQKSKAILSRTLNQMIRAKLTNAREMADLAGVSTSTVYRWIAGDSQPDFDSVRLLLRHLPNRKAQEALLAAFTGGTEWTFSRVEMDLDINHDGKIDVDDALDAAIETVHSSAEALKQTRAASRTDTIKAEEAMHLIQTLNQTVRHCSVVQQVLIQISDEQSKRKKLRLVE